MSHTTCSRPRLARPAGRPAALKPEASERVAAVVDAPFVKYLDHTPLGCPVSVVAAVGRPMAVRTASATTTILLPTRAQRTRDRPNARPRGIGRSAASYARTPRTP